MGREDDGFCRKQLLLLERVSSGAPLGEVLDGIVHLIEQQPGDMLCSILLLDRVAGVVRHGAAPNLPPEYVRVLDGSPIGPHAGSCGRAAALGERVIIEDIATHPDWESYRHLALPHGLRACWSSPIFSRSNEVLGTFAMYYREPRGPTDEEMEWVATATHLAAIAISHDRTQRALTASELRSRQLARLYAVSSSVNEAITRLENVDALYAYACRVAVEQGLARLSWIGLYDETEDRIRPVARFGADDGYVDSILLSLKDERINRGPAARVLASGRVALSADVEADPGFFFKHEALSRGLRSCAVFPITQRGRTIGVFALYAAMPHAFQAEEIRVLEGLAADISFAVDSAQAESERRRFEAALRSSEQRLKTMIESSPNVSIQWYDIEGRILYSNKASERLLGMSAEQAVGKRLDQLNFAPEEADRFRTALAAVARSGQPAQQMEFQFCLPDGSIGEVLSTIFELPVSEGERCFVCMDVDLTARKRLEQQLQHAQRLQALGTLAGGIAHDFNNVLAAITGNVELALMDAGPEHPVRESLLEIETAAGRAKDLVMQILSFSRREVPIRTVIDPREVIGEVARLLRASMPASVVLELSLAADTPSVLANGSQLHQVLMNLGTNAAMALDAFKGLVRISSERVVLSDESAPGGLAPGCYTRISVRDTGCGMDAATLGRMFEPFFTTRLKGHGTGLGLSVVHGIMHNHGGAVTVDSSLGQGSTFSLFFHAADAPASPELARRGTSALGKGKHILYVDDEDALVSVASRGLSRAGYRVTTHSDARSALSDFRSRSAEFDAVVADFTMPGLSGPELVRELRLLRPDLPVVMLTGYMHPEDVESARELGVGDVMLKPYSVDELALAIELRLNPQA